jgi:hypothetical protein
MAKFQTEWLLTISAITLLSVKVVIPVSIAAVQNPEHLALVTEAENSQKTTRVLKYNNTLPQWSFY